MKAFVLLLLLSIAFPFYSCGQVPDKVIDTVQSTASLPKDTVVKKPRKLDRFEKEILRYESLDREAAPKTGGILFMGSSSIRLWKSVATDMSPMPVINRGFGGATIAEVNFYFRRMVLKYKPKMLVFYTGENDLFHTDIPVDSVMHDFDRFRDSMETHLPECRMLFISVKPSPARWSFQEKFLEANRRFQAVCEADPKWTYVDIIPQMLNAEGRPRPEIYRSDSLHMNAAGYAEWAKTIKPPLKAAWDLMSKLVPKTVK